MSRDRKGKRNNKSIPVYQYDINGSFIKKWDFQCDAEKELGLAKTTIGKCIHGKHVSTGGYFWSKVKYDNYIKENKILGKSVYQYDLNGEFIKQWNSIKEAATSFNVDDSAIRHAVLGNNNSSCGFQWRDYKLEKIDKVQESKRVLNKIKQINLEDGSFKVFNNMRELHGLVFPNKSFRTVKGGIQAAYSGKRKQMYGFGWEIIKPELI